MQENLQSGSVIMLEDSCRTVCLRDPFEWARTHREWGKRLLKCWGTSTRREKVSLILEYAFVCYPVSFVVFLKFFWTERSKRKFSNRRFSWTTSECRVFKYSSLLSINYLAQSSCQFCQLRDCEKESGSHPFSRWHP